jgi:hypothetical protein
MIQIQRPPLLASLALSCFALCACQTDKHTMVEPKDGTVIVCKLCYDEVYKERHPTGSRWGGMRTETHTRHVCPSCQTEMSIYTQNGVTMVKCAKCAPEGLACDKCLPPKGWTPPKPVEEPASK